MADRSGLKLTGIILASLAIGLCFVLETGAQVIPGMTYSGAFEAYYQTWDITEGDETTTVNQLIMPISLFLPVTDRFDVRLASSYSSFGRDVEGGGTESLSGLTDVRVQANYALLSRKFLIGVIANLPTGQGKLTDAQQDIVYSFISPDLSVRANRLGEGFNLGGALTYAAPVSENAVLSLGAGLVSRGGYDTSLPTSDSLFRLDPGIVASGSIGIDFFTGPSHFRLGSTLSQYATERKNGDDYYRIGQEIAVEANYGLAYSQARGRFTAGLYQIIRLNNSVVDNDEFVAEPISTNGSYLAVSAANRYTVVRSVILDVSALARIIGKNEFNVGNSTVFEGGLGLTIMAAQGIAVTLGGRYMTGTGTGFTGLKREIRGIEGTFRLVAQVPG